MLVYRYRKVAVGVLAAIFLMLACATAEAIDPEGCQVCHRYRGLARLDNQSQTIRLFYVDPTYYDRALGPHARLLCTDCHKDSGIQVIPHQPTSPVDCTQSCHLTRPDKLEVYFAHNQI